jgi:uncharacterized heparinase superfamily protein
MFSPQDLRTADPTVATDIYAGLFVFSGRALQTQGRMPFDYPCPSNAWGEALYGFGWLRHLRAANTALSRINARALVDDYLVKRGRRRRIARRTPVVSRRLISFLSQAPLLLDGADHAFYTRFLRSIAQDVAQLERDVRGRALPVDRLTAAVALCIAGLCCEGLEGTLRRATRLLERELDAQILPDGGHAGRNPRVLVDLLLDFLPLRQIFMTRGAELPSSLVRAIDRMLPMVRLFRHGDGMLSHFNGMGLTAADHLATLLMYDEARSRPMTHAPHSGYERMEAEGLLVVADVGAMPPTMLSGEAHAGCLSFELSSGSQRIVVNCAAPRHAREAASLAARSTAAHSTAVIGEASSASFLAPEGWWPDRALARWLRSRVGAVMLTGPREVASERSGPLTLIARHDGYSALFGVVHERRFVLAPAGDRLDGEDRFALEGSARRPAHAMLRFHLAPGVRASQAEGSSSVVLTLPNRETWQFDAEAETVGLEESVFFAAMNGSRRTQQIVASVPLGPGARATWRFERLPG